MEKNGEFRLGSPCEFCSSPSDKEITMKDGKVRYLCHQCAARVRIPESSDVSNCIIKQAAEQLTVSHVK